SATTRRAGSPPAAERRQEGRQLRGPDRPLHVPREALVVRDLLVHPRELRLEAGLLRVEVPDRVDELLLSEPPPLELHLRVREAVRHGDHRREPRPPRRVSTPSRSSTAPPFRDARRAPNCASFL